MALPRRRVNSQLRNELAELEERLLPIKRAIGAAQVVERAEKRLDDLRAGRAVHKLHAGIVGMPMDGPLLWTLTGDDELVPEVS
jgi:hypothetical protein